jgi:hypothetical protein
MGWLGEQKVKHPSLGLQKISAKCDDNSKMMLENENLCMLSKIFA